MRTWLSTLALALTGAACAPSTECRIEEWPGWDALGADQPTELGFTPREAAELFTFEETFAVTDADGVAHEVHAALVVSIEDPVYAEHVNAGETIGEDICSAGSVIVGPLDIHLSTDDGFFDDRISRELRVDRPLLESTPGVEGREGFVMTSGSWAPDGGGSKYFDLVLEGGPSGARVARFEAGGLLCNVKGPCFEHPEMTYEAP